VRFFDASGAEVEVPFEDASRAVTAPVRFPEDVQDFLSQAVQAAAADCVASAYGIAVPAPGEVGGMEMTIAFPPGVQVADPDAAWATCLRVADAAWADATASVDVSVPAGDSGTS
jgi:hypothetical protein